MHRIPLYRHAFMWFFVIIFFVAAPFIVFYTAGYQWNQKKGLIERNGTIILDTNPNGAVVTLNGSKLTSVTPTTILHVAPGTYHVRLEKDGYEPWEKTFEVHSELVTFVNEIELWMKSEPERIVQEVYSGSLYAAPNERYLAMVTQEESAIRIIDLTDNGVMTVPLRTASSSTVERCEWSPDSAALLVRLNDGSYGVVLRANEGYIELPQAESYRWEENVLIGVHAGTRIEYSPAWDKLERIELGKNVFDVRQGLELTFTASTSRYVLRDPSVADRAYELPIGAWSFGEAFQDVQFVHAKDEWYGFSPGKKDPFVRFPSRIPPVPLRMNGEWSVLGYLDGELWLYPLQQTPVLLVRKSQPIKGAAWHRRGGHIFYATSEGVYVLELDAHETRQEIRIGSFSNITGMTLIRDTLYVTGMVDGSTGIWSYQLK